MMFSMAALSLASCNDKVSTRIFHWEYCYFLSYIAQRMTKFIFVVYLGDVGQLLRKGGSAITVLL